MKPEPKITTPAAKNPKSSVSRKLGKKPIAPPSFAVILADVGQIATVGNNSVAVAGLAATLDERR